MNRMNADVEKVVEIWQQSYSGSIKNKSDYQSKDQLAQLAALFTPGNSFYYIINFFDMKFEYISDSVEELLGFPKDDLSIEKLLSQAYDLHIIRKKEDVIQDFALNQVSGKEIMDYKFMYTYRITTPKKAERTMLMQTITLSMTEDDKVQHVLAIHSDITHLKVPVDNHINIVNIRGGKSYFNVSVDEGVFNSSLADKRTKKINPLTERETELANLLAKGLSTKLISQELHISENTVITHRRNMMRKLNCANSTQLVVQCIAEGVVSL